MTQTGFLFGTGLAVEVRDVNKTRTDPDQIPQIPPVMRERRRAPVRQSVAAVRQLVGTGGRIVR